MTPFIRFGGEGLFDLEYFTNKNINGIMSMDDGLCNSNRDIGDNFGCKSPTDWMHFFSTFS